MSSECDTKPKRRRKPRKTIAVLLSCVLFLFVVCACLLTALVLIGKHMVYNVNPPRRQNIPLKNPNLLWRLPNDTYPISYDITLRPFLDSGKFRGSVAVKVNLTRSRKDIVLNSKNLAITSADLTDLNVTKRFQIEKIHEKPDDEVLQVEAREVLHPGIYKLEIHYEGTLLNKTKGFYRSQRKDNATGTKKYMATSKFEPTYARQAFPCFDEPNMKAKYTVHLVKPKDTEYIALSNYPSTGEEVVDEGIMVHFEETVPMSTYLSCFIVSDFISTNHTFENMGKTIPFNVYATPAQLEKTSYAGEVGKKVMEFYVSYFNIPYPLPKLDMVAIPDFVSGAMEHWGLVTYRETALLYSPETHSASNKQRVATVVAHELAHSWFGNLVTMDWWNNLWLNEGFASYIEYKGTHAAEPTWQMMDQFLTSELHSVLSLDATQGSHPIIVTVTTPDQITEVFDTISYNKGASILRMLESVVGEENFQKGVTNYLNKFAYGNSISQNLWDELQNVVGDALNVTAFMDTFTIQMGYPILEVTVNDNKYTFTQKRFLKDYGTVGTQTPSPLGYKWDIPITYVTNEGKSTKIEWFYHDQDTFVIEKPASAEWIKFNPDQVGYYRVNYASNDWNSLAVNFDALSNSDKVHLLEESFAIAESGDLSYAIPLDLTKNLINETDYVLWSVGSSQLQGIAKYLQTSQYDAAFKTYVVGLLKKAYSELTWDDSDDSESHLRKLARVVIINLACAMDDADALTEAKEQFTNWIKNRTTTNLSQNLRSIIYKFGMVTADESTWSELFTAFAEETDANEKLKLLNGLANVRNPSLLTKLIVLAEDETYIRSQDYFTLLGYISANPVGQPIVWDYVRENWLKLVTRFGLNDRYLGSLITTITSRFLAGVKTEEMRSFFEKYPDAGAGAAARVRALETVSNNIKWLSQHKEVVEKWISNNKF